MRRFFDICIGLKIMGGFDYEQIRRHYRADRASGDTQG